MFLDILYCLRVCFVIRLLSFLAEPRSNMSKLAAVNCHVHVGQKVRSVVYVRRLKDTRLYYTSAQRYIRPTIIVLILRTLYPHVVFQQLLAAVVPMNCMSDTQSIFKKLAYPTYNWRPAHLPIGWMQSFEGRLHCISTGHMNNLRRSDAQHQ